MGEALSAYPHNHDAERSVLGAILLRGESLQELGDLRPQHFYRTAHAHMFKALLDLDARGTALDFVTLKAELERAGLLEECGGPLYLSGLADGLPRATNVQHYARLVHEDALRRALIAEGERLRRLAVAAEGSPRELLEATETRLLELDRRANGMAREPMDTVAVSRELQPQLAEWWQGPASGRRGGMGTGLVALDHLIRGMKPGMLLVIGARPSMGKSAFLLQMALHVASTHPVLFSSLEMTQREMSLRALSMLTGTYPVNYIDGDIKPSPHAQEVISAALTIFSTLQLGFHDVARLSVSSLRSTARRWQHQHGLGLLLVDYLQLVQSEKGHGRRDDTRATELGRISSDLKALAVELQVPLVVASQLNRELEHRPDKRPILADLRESGSIEQDADIVLLLHRPSYYDKTQDLSHAELHVAKHRNGRTGSVLLTWLPEITTFRGRAYDVAQKPQEPL